MAPRRWEYRATSASSIRGRHELVMTAEGQSRRRQRHKFCTILGDEVTVLHLVRFGKRAGPKLERRKAFEYPVWTVPTPYLIWAHFLGPGGACVSRGKHQASSGAVIIFFRNAFRTGIEWDLAEHLGAWQRAGQTLQGGEISSGVLLPPSCSRAWISPQSHGM